MVMSYVDALPRGECRQRPALAAGDVFVVPTIAVGTALSSHGVGPPPAQIRAGAISALGSCLGFWRQTVLPLAAHVRAHWTRWSGSESGARFARPCSPWPGSFPPPPPRPAQARLCSAISSVLRARLTSPGRASSASGSWPFRRGPTHNHAGRPGDLPVLAQRGSVRARGLRPRRAARLLAFSATSVLPSTSDNSVGALERLISRLNTRPARAPVERFTAILADGSA